MKTFSRTIGFLLLFSTFVLAENLQFDSDSLYEHGLRLRKANYFQQAMTQWEKVLETDPKHLNTLTGLTELHYFLGNFEKCLDYGTKAIKQNPSNVDLYFQVGSTFSYVGRNQEAVELLKKGFQLDPSRIDFLFQIAELEYALGSFKACRKTASEILKKEPKNLKAIQQIGLAWGAENKKKKARTWFEKALQKNASFSPALFSLALLDLENEQLDLAQQRLEQVVELEHVHPRAFFYLALLEQKKKNRLKEYYWLKRAETYFSKKSDEFQEILKRRELIEQAFSFSREQMEAYLQSDLLVELGDSKEEVVKQIGSPLVEKKQLFLYPKQGLALFFEQGNVVKIECEKSFTGKVHGFKIGDSLKDIVGLYGKGIKTPKGVWGMWVQNQIVTFELNQGRINKIILTREL